jgi:hypothetical protein
MSLSTQAIDRLFTRLGATYGAQWDKALGSAPLGDVKTLWAHELSAYAGSLHRIAWALENLPPRCPNVIEFKQLCRQAPAPEAPALPEPKADPERLKRELAKLSDMKATITATPSKVDHKAWAKRILARYTAGERINPTSLRFAREALRSEGV